MITSVHNPRVQAVRKLQAQAKSRREEKAFVIEGVRLADEALRADWSALDVFYTDHLDERGKTVVDGFAARRVPIEQVTEPVMHAISETATPQGLLVVLKYRILPMPSPLNFVLIMDRVRDPGNLGTVLRTAVAAGVQAVLLAPTCVDAWSPKVLRAGMGAHFALPIYNLGWNEIQQVTKGPHNRLRVYLADASEGIPYTNADFDAPLAVIVGGEAAGVGAEAISIADMKVHIPMPGGSESLNAAIATSILLFEVVRQRGM